MPLDATPTRPRAATEAAMDRALALAAAAGRADGIAARVTVPLNPALANLLYRLLLYAAVTRDPALWEFVPEYRHRARNAVACYRALKREGQA